MSVTVCLLANTLDYPEGGGHLWVYLNYALGLRAVGCRVIWMEGVAPRTPAAALKTRVAALRSHLEPFGLAQDVALCSWSDAPLAQEAGEGCMDVEAASEADLLLNFAYGMPPGVVGRFRRSALMDIDPGLLQVWMSEGDLRVAPHNAYFTIGETVGRPEARFPDAGLQWRYAPRCVALDWWPPHRAAEDAPFTTVSHWSEEESIEDAGELYRNDKRSGFLPYLDLPKCTRQPLELALCLAPEEEEDRTMLLERGWRVRHAHTVTSTPWDYRRYVQESRGEFSCAKPSCLHMQNAWISDRTLCYLASGKPAVVQHTGPSRFLPDSSGLFRFRNLDEAVRCLDAAAADYDRQCRLARALVEEHMDARKVVACVLEQVLA
jgi:hypothetical protein